MSSENTELNSLRSFEDNLQFAEEVANQLERGEITIEKALDLYAKGIQALKHCESTMNAIELQIQTLTVNISPNLADPKADDSPEFPGSIE